MTGNQCESNTMKEAVGKSSGFLRAAESKIDIDVSDALKGLKALRREANETIKVLDQLQVRLNRGIVASSEDGEERAIFHSDDGGLTIKRGDVTVTAKNPTYETIEEVIEVVDSVEIGKSIYVANNVKKLSQFVIKHITDKLVIDIDSGTVTPPRLLIKIKGEMITLDAKKGENEINLGKPTNKNEGIELYATSPKVDGVSIFTLKGIYLKH